ncbi:ABC transporter permease [Fodinicola feengrottensis]|uniref:ABC transporter permease n=1 Tax=Fodinicola feengrottensis TaxID=435914 RepID=UPI002440FE17|nr:ABC transporter permease [Fodinicola feengrottensis]
MRKIVVRWLLTAVPLVLGVSMLTFVLASLVPGDAARAILGVNASPAQYVALRRQLHLDEPLWQQYVHWLAAAVHGDLGQSLQSSDAVTHELSGRLGVTLSLVGGAVLVATAVGVGLGGSRARCAVVFLGRLVDVGSLLGLAVPSYWLGLVLVALFAVALPLFPRPPATPRPPTRSAAGWPPWSCRC